MRHRPDASAQQTISESIGADERMRLLYERHARPVYRFLLRLTFGERQVAEDLLQETLLRAWRNLDELNSDIDTLRPWLFTVARRVAIDAGRARQVRPAAADNVDLAEFPAAEDSIERLLAAETIRGALKSLTEDHRRVIVEIYFNSRTVAEAAAILGIPEGTVKSRTFHALRTLRGAIGVQP